MSRIKLIYYLFVLLVPIFFVCNCSYSDTYKIDHRENIERYEDKLTNDPGNCFYLDQIASSYQALNEHLEAIKFYERVLDNCPDNYLSRFQFGISHYLIMEKDKGVLLMDEAISAAEKKGDTAMAQMFKTEKKTWLEKWDLVKELEWNKDKL